MNKVNNLPSITVEIFTKIVEAQFREKNYRPIFGLGKGGIGKTESIKDLTTKLGIGYVDIRLLLYSETDLKGIPYPNAEHTKTVWLQNNILPTVEKDGETGILVLDEITSCSRSVRTAAYQLLNERRLGEYVLPDGWLIVCLGNGEEDGGDYNGIEGNFANRCSVFNVVVDTESWKNWATAHGINELVMAFISFKPEYLHSFDPDKETDILFASPRSWTGVSDIINYAGYNRDDFVLQSRIIGNVGKLVGDTFIAFCRYKDDTVDPMEILKGNTTIKFNKHEVLLITIQSCVKMLSERLARESAAKQLTVESIQYVANFTTWLLTSTSLDNAVMGLKDLLRNNKEAIKAIILNPNSNFRALCPEWSKFISEHGDILF